MAVGIFSGNPQPIDTTGGKYGLFHGKFKMIEVRLTDWYLGGGWYFLGVQTLSALSLLSWAMISTFVLLWMIDKITPIRMEPNEELLGADLCEHNIRHAGVS